MQHRVNDKVVKKMIKNYIKQLNQFKKNTSEHRQKS